MQSANACAGSLAVSLVVCILFQADLHVGSSPTAWEGQNACVLLLFQLTG